MKTRTRWKSNYKTLQWCTQNTTKWIDFEREQSKCWLQGINKYPWRKPFWCRLPVRFRESIRWWILIGYDRRNGKRGFEIPDNLQLFFMMTGIGSFHQTANGMETYLQLKWNICGCCILVSKHCYVKTKGSENTGGNYFMAMESCKFSSCCVYEFRMKEKPSPCDDIEVNIQRPDITSTRQYIHIQTTR